MMITNTSRYTIESRVNFHLTGQVGPEWYHSSNFPVESPGAPESESTSYGGCR